MAHTCRFGLALILLLTLHGDTWSQTFTKILGSPVVTDVSSNYSGAAWIDWNGDGRLDLFVNNNFLYAQNANGTFARKNTTIGAGVAIATGNGQTWGDYDNDGDPDIYLCGSNSFLYRNDGSLGFARIDTGEIGDGFANRGWSCAWSDYDNDGNLDLAITHPAGFLPGGSTTNHLFLSDGPPDYSFTRVSRTPITTGLTSYTVGAWSDFDQDGDADYFVGAGPANGTTQPDFLYRNMLSETGSADFLRIFTAPIGTDAQDGQLWNWIDYDNDGDLDAYLTNWRGPTTGLANRLYRQDAEGFVAVTGQSIATDANPSLSSVWGDYDNDGDLDCFVANDDSQADRYYRNNGDGTFSGVTNVLTESVTHRGGAAGDYDGDGDLDLFVDGPNGGRSLFRNDTSNGNHWLEVRLEGVISNRSAIGARVWVEASIAGNDVRQLREVSAQNTFNGHSALDPHFGLGDASVIERLVIEWPSGIVQSRADVAVDTLIELAEVTSVLAVPDGAAIPGTPLQASRSGSDVAVTWDGASCPAVAVNLYHGSMGDFTAFTGATCDLPGTGSATVSLPSDVWFLVAATDGVSVDGDYGRDSSGESRGITGASVVCPGMVEHVVNDQCP